MVANSPDKASVSATIAALVAEDMVAVDAWIAQQLQSPVVLIEQVGQYILQAGGKRLRPTLLLLMSQALGYQGAQRHNLAAVVEFIHTATLLHDDVVDASALRRSKPTANAVFGNAASVLVGDFLYSRAFQMMVQCAQLRVLQILADATNRIAQGEVLQLMNTRNADLTQEQYRDVINSKTARLFEASCELAAVLAEVDAPTMKACADYGRQLGMAFQMIDDVLDYAGVADQMGKNLGDDLREGKMTLPLIMAMQLGTAADQAVIRQVIEQGDAAHSIDSPQVSSPWQRQLAQVQAILQRSGALQASADIALAQAECAAQCLQALAPSAAQAALVQLPLSLLHRQA